MGYAIVGSSNIYITVHVVHLYRGNNLQDFLNSEAFVSEKMLYSLPTNTQNTQLLPTYQDM